MVNIIVMFMVILCLCMFSCYIIHAQKLHAAPNSFGLTENYVVFMEQPLKVDVRKMLLYNVIRKPAIGALRWDPNENVSFLFSW